jgi:L-Ala-D/L-Glu epimerase / N-acetyl-D-glutamate racemase
MSLTTKQSPFMKITAYRLYQMTLNCIRPFKIATGLRTECQTLLVELEDESGCRGHGEAVPIPLLTDESLVGCEWTLKEQLLPLLRGRDPFCLKDIHAEMLALTRAKSARCAVDIALYNLQAKHLGIPLSRLLGTANHKFETNYSIGICDLDETQELALEFQNLGYTRIKLKVGIDPDYDLERILKLNETLRPEVLLRLDANCGWTRHQALAVLRGCEKAECRIEFVEQPVAREDFQGLRVIRERSPYPIAADESVQNAEDALRLLEGRCVDILNLKLMKTGGLLPALRVVHLARAYRCQLMVGGMVGESEISVSAAASLAAANGFEFADLDADILLKDSPFEASPPGKGNLKLEVPYRTWDGNNPTRTDTLSPAVELLTEWSA